MDKYLLGKLKMKENNWLGICKTKLERFIVNSEDLITASVGILVEITSLAIYLILLKCRKWCSLFPVRVKDFSMDTPFQQHDNLNVALESWYSGDHTVIFPGEYEAVNLSLLTKDIIIRPYSGKPEEPVIVSKSLHENFVVSKAQDTNLTYLRSVQQRTVNGVVVAESNVWLTGASLTITGSEITGAQGTGVELYPRSTAILESYKIHHCNTAGTRETSHHSQGAINVKVVAGEEK
ncbi:LOW QUALITY PROTEIN: testicular spindle-associated protein SHCBP1L [Ciconia maguari]